MVFLFNINPETFHKVLQQQKVKIETKYEQSEK